MAGPFKCTVMLLKIFGNTVGVVEGASIELEIEGGIEHTYGAREGHHAAGGKRATFSLRRWFMSDTDTDLLYDLFNDEIPFTLSGEIDGQAGSTIELSNCKIYRWRPVMGGPNDIVAEEASGEAVSWAGSNIL